MEMGWPMLNPGLDTAHWFPTSHLESYTASPDASKRPFFRSLRL